MIASNDTPRLSDMFQDGNQPSRMPRKILADGHRHAVVGRQGFSQRGKSLGSFQRLAYRSQRIGQRGNRVPMHGYDSGVGNLHRQAVQAIAERNLHEPDTDRGQKTEVGSQRTEYESLRFIISDERGNPGIAS